MYCCSRLGDCNVVAVADGHCGDGLGADDGHFDGASGCDALAVLGASMARAGEIVAGGKKHAGFAWWPGQCFRPII